MNKEKFSDGRLITEGMLFYYITKSPYKPITLTTVKNEDYPKSSTREWLFIDEDGNDYSDEWYFFNGEYLEEI